MMILMQLGTEEVSHICDYVLYLNKQIEIKKGMHWYRFQKTTTAPSTSISETFYILTDCELTDSSNEELYECISESISNFRRYDLIHLKLKDYCKEYQIFITTRTTHVVESIRS